MNLPEEAPKLPLLPFLIGDVVLLIAAAVIATRGAAPLGPTELFAITICVVVGAALLVVPFLANYARHKDAELSERQNQIAALARTTAESAEQLGIAAAGLHSIAETSKHNLDAIAKLPGKIETRINDITQQLAGSALASQNTLKADLAQLEAAADKIVRTLAKIDSATHAKTDTLAAAEKDLAATLARATTQIGTLVSDAVTHAVRSSEPATPSPAEPPAAPKPARNKNRPSPAPQPTPATESAPVPAEAIAEQPVPETPAPADAVSTSADTPPEATPTPEPPSEPTAAPAPEPAPESTVFAPTEPESAEVPVAEPEAPKPPRARKNKSADESALDLGLTPDPATDLVETARSSDGFTRLTATAYIGIGNKLFVRGDGPGLSWDKGVPLQFVSIGKWRWETADATGPIRVKLYKNDQIECRGLGELTLEPAHQHEVNAGF